MSEFPASPDAAAVEPIPGFRILGLAGRGGMATVYRAEQASPRRIVALKVMSRASDPARLAEFRREAAMVAALEHPRVVPLYGYGEHRGLPYLVLRHLAGGTAADRIRRGRLSLEEAGGIVLSIADALDFAHQRGLVHRDIKPSNFLLDEAGRAYLSDFGIAGALVDPKSASAAGSAAYMSPEQARGATVDRRSDVYALAASLFEMVTGSPPYTAETAVGMMVRHARDPIPSARDRNPDLPPALDELLLWSLAKAPADRPADAAEFARLFRQALAQPAGPLRLPTPALPTAAAPPRPRAGVRSWWAAIPVAALCLLAAALLGGGALGAFLSRPPTAASTSPPPPASPQILAPTSVGGLPLTDNFSDSASGFAVSADSDGRIAYIDGSLRILSSTAGVEWFSPSGRVDSGDVAIQVHARVLAPNPSGEVGLACRWNGLEDYVGAVWRGDGSVAVWERVGGERLFLLEAPPGPDEPVPQDAELALSCAGSRVRFTADGLVLAEADGATSRAGDISLWAGILGAGSFEVAFDDLSAMLP